MMKAYTRRSKLLSSGLLLALCASMNASMASPAARQDAPPEETEGEVKRLAEWPSVDNKAAKFELERLRKARTQEMGEQGQDALIKIGAGSAPFLLAKYGKEKDKLALQRMTEVLETVTGPAHTRLLAEYFTDKDLATRVWCLKRVALFADPGVSAAAEKAYAAADKRKRNRDKEEVYAAAACCASSGSFTGFELLCKDSAKNWKKHGTITHTALTSLRGAEATKRIAPLFEGADRAGKVAALHLLAACGDKEAATSLVAPLLDSTDNSLRVGAINALRGIIDGDPPLPRLPVFEAIERANKWKTRV
ncbi:MAG: hypothetical protein ACI9F9_003261 [Candidatus Paceibacteria bacterium]|jgi:hypothetical protein